MKEIPSTPTLLVTSTSETIPLPNSRPLPTLLPTTSSLVTPLPTATPTFTLVPSPSSTFTPSPSSTPSPWPTVTRLVLPDSTAAFLPHCRNRDIPDDLLTVVTQQFGLPGNYEPQDLIPLSDYYGYEITRGFNTRVRAVILEPMMNILAAMQNEGLRPSIISGYRSRVEQALAWNMWEEAYPERVAIMSARPGYSEHQLGTTIDFGSPVLEHKFHVQFAETSEGQWLAKNAHLYGFVLSYPLEALELTGFKFEPWHYRYVGVEMATMLYNSGITLTQWHLENMPPPCIP